MVFEKDFTTEYMEVERTWNGTFVIYNLFGEEIKSFSIDSLYQKIMIGNNGNIASFGAIDGLGRKSKLKFFSNAGNLVKEIPETFGYLYAGNFSMEGFFALFAVTDTMMCESSCPTTVNLYDNNFDLIAHYTFKDDMVKPNVRPLFDEVNKYIIIRSYGGTHIKYKLVSYIFDYKCSLIRKENGWAREDY